MGANDAGWGTAQIYDVKPEWIGCAIANDLALLAAHPGRQSNRRSSLRRGRRSVRKRNQAPSLIFDSGGFFAADYDRLSGRAHPQRPWDGARMGIFCSRFVPGEPSLSQPSGGFLVCQRGHRRDSSMLEHEIRFANRRSEALNLASPGWHFLAFRYFEPGGRRILPCGLFIAGQSLALVHLELTVNVCAASRCGRSASLRSAPGYVAANAAWAQVRALGSTFRAVGLT
jgi:hypothetical protein